MSFSATFYKFYPDGSQTRDTVECKSYQVCEMPNGLKVVTVRPKQHVKGGIEYRVSAYEEDFSSCEIKNSEGLPMEFIRGFEQPELN